jgi:hypothetical protein
VVWLFAKDYWRAADQLALLPPAEPQIFRKVK